MLKPNKLRDARRISTVTIMAKREPPRSCDTAPDRGTVPSWSGCGVLESDTYMVKLLFIRIQDSGSTTSLPRPPSPTIATLNSSVISFGAIWYTFKCTCRWYADWSLLCHCLQQIRRGKTLATRTSEAIFCARRITYWKGLLELHLPIWPRVRYHFRSV